MIDILMATYNGSNYIRNQLLSLQQQTEKNWTLYIRDDGSTDDTIEIINDFSSKDSRIKVVTDSLGNLGPGKTFLELTNYSTSDYVIFCDQDDIWFEKKIENLLAFANNKLSDDKPGLVYCDGYGYNSEKGIISLNSISRAHAKNLNEFLFFNAGYQGCSMFFNRKLCQLAQSYNTDFYMHDDIVSLLAHTFGDVYFLDEALMLYRQHSNNVTGNIQFGFLGFVKRAVNFGGYVISKKHYEEKKSFFDFYKDQLNTSQVEIFNAYFDFPNQTLTTRIRSIFKHNLSEGGNQIKLLSKTILRHPLEK